MRLTSLILGIHVAIILFNVIDLALIPIGAKRGWGWVHRPAWRIAQLLCWAVVAVQAASGRACFLTVWQDKAAGQATSTPLIERWVDALVYWPPAIWVFAACYIVLFGIVMALFWLVPLRRRRAA